MEEKIIEAKGKKYSIILEKESGGYGTVYLVKDNETNKYYAAKLLKENSNYQSEVEINEKLKKLKIPNIVKYIESGTVTITLKDKKPEERNYLLLEYYPKKDLLKYIKFSGGLEEKFSKVLFKKVLETVQNLHINGIFHLDLKLNNILLDDEFNPKIGDFGLSKTKEESYDNKFIGNFGTKAYKPPQMHLNTSFDGAKADIFSLGVTLFKLVTNSFPFKIAYKAEEFYKLIMEEEYNDFWAKISTKNIEVSNEFKNLFVKMVAFDEDKRPDIEAILSDEWFYEIKNLNDEAKINLKNDYISAFKEKEEKINDQLNPTEDVKPKQKPESFNEEIFKNEKNINYADDEKLFDNYIKIKGNLNPFEFMNYFANRMEDIFDDIIIDQKNLKFNIIKKKDDKDEEEIEKNLNIQIELFKVKNEEYILNFIKKEGELNDYYKYLIDIINDAKEFI